jgi:hypothetical protein
MPPFAATIARLSWRSFMMNDRFVVEADRRVVGLAVRVPGGYRFFSSHPDYFVLESRTFARAKEIASKVAEIARSIPGAAARKRRRGTLG